MNADDEPQKSIDLAPTDAQILAHPKVQALVDAGENMAIAIGMGWDLDGVFEVLIEALAALEPKP